jgi:Tol biopolymer transport system component
LGPLNEESGDIGAISLARGDRRLAYGVGVPSDIWIQTLPAGEPSRFTFGPEPGWSYPIWSPDGADLIYASQDLSGYPEYEMRRRSADRTGADVTLLRSETAFYPWDWSPDGRWVAYGDEWNDLWLLPLEEGAESGPEPVRWLEAIGVAAYAQFSPDGKLLAYASDEQGQLEIFVGTIPRSAAVWQISTSGGAMPRWRRDGRELFYRATDGTLMAVELGAGSGAAAIDGRSSPRALPVSIPSAGNSPTFTYAPADDGQRFLITAVRESAMPPIIVVVNWWRELEER